MLINTGTGKTEKEFTFPVLNPGANPHVQSAGCRDEGGKRSSRRIAGWQSLEYDANFKESGHTRRFSRGRRRGLERQYVDHQGSHTILK